MAIPTQPTDTSIVTEALKKFGYQTPSSTQISRAITEGLEYVKRDIMDAGTTWKFLINTNYFSTTIGVSRYAVPTDYERFIEARVLDGSSAGTAVGGSTAVMTLAATESISTNIFRGNYLLVTGGAGSGQLAQISSYSTARVATFDAVLSTAVDATSTYLVVTDFWPLEDKPIFSLKDIRRPQISRMPTVLMHQPNEIEGKFLFDFTPDKLYGVELLYYMDLRKVDLTATRYNTLLRRIAGLLTQGVFVWTLQDDDRYKEERQIYMNMLAKLGSKNLYGLDLSNAQCQVET